MNTDNLTHTLCEASKRGLGISSLAVLIYCSEHEGVILTRLATLLGKSTAGITGIADKLQAKGLVARRSILGDRRSWTLELTDHGIGILHNILSTPLPNQQHTTTA